MPPTSIRLRHEQEAELAALARDLAAVSLLPGVASW